MSCDMMNGKSTNKIVEIPVVYATDQHYLFYTCVSITSLAENAALNTFYRVYVLTGESFRDEENLIEALNERYANIEIVIITVEAEIFTHVYINNEHITKAAFYRLAICDSIDEERCIYLDSDTLVTEDLQELWDCEIEPYYLAGCRDVWIDWLTETEYEQRRVKSHLPGMEDYVNSGVLVFNLKKVREDRLNETFIEHMSIQYPYEDQDILNVCCYGHIFKLPTKWNNFTAGIGYDLELRAAGVSEKILQVFKTSKGIIHYIGIDFRPWEGRLSWKNQDWWQFAEKWSGTKVYKQIYKYVVEKEEQGCWKDLLKKTQFCQMIIIWGYTKYGKELSDWLVKAQLHAKIYFCDSDKEKCSQIYKDIIVLSTQQAFEQVSKIKQDYLFLIASQRQGEQIREEILKHEMLSECILLYRRKDMDFYRRLDSRYYERELEEIFLKEAINVPPEQRMQELQRHEEWIDKYYLRRWILKTK